MNNEIKQLCEQAKAYANESTKEFIGDEPVVWMDYYTEKFAELIVYDMLGELTNDDSLGPARIETIRQLSLRYGVAR